MPSQTTAPGYLGLTLRVVAALLVLINELQAQALACTLCHSRIAEDVRAAVFGPDLWDNVGALLLLVPILMVAVVLVQKLSP